MSKLSWKCIYHTNKIEQIFFPDTTENENKILALSFSREISPLNLKKKKKNIKTFSNCFKYSCPSLFISVYLDFLVTAAQSDLVYTT